MWFHKKKAANDAFENWKAAALERIDGCLKFWKTHSVFWEENEAEAEEIAHCLKEAGRIFMGISFRKDAATAGYCDAADKHLTAIERNRSSAESYTIVLEESRALLSLAQEWINR